MNFYGLAMSVIMILATGLGHIIVIKWEYYWGVKTWPGLFAIGVALVLGSFLTDNNLISGGSGIMGATLLWGVHELFKQEKRVEQGLFPKRPAGKH